MGFPEAPDSNSCLSLTLQASLDLRGHIVQVAEKLELQLGSAVDLSVVLSLIQIYQLFRMLGV